VAEGNEVVGRSDGDNDEIDDGEETLRSTCDVKLCIRARVAPLLGDVAVGESDCASRIRFCNCALSELFVTVWGMPAALVVTAVVSGWRI
jgi:hypothetical protein